MTFGEALQKMVKSRGITYTKLAQEADIPLKALSNWVYDRSLPKLIPCKKIARVLGITLDEFAEMID
jgi:transcriptional regulator with XRE-family HTH domain